MRSKECTKMIISEVKKRPILWSSHHPKYYDRRGSDRAWHYVSAAVGLPKETVKSKWKNIKDHFTKEYKKTPHRRSGHSAPVYNGKWPHFQSLLFLKAKTIKLEIETDGPDEGSSEDTDLTQEPGSSSANVSEETQYFDTRINYWNSDTGTNQQGTSVTATSVLLQNNPLVATPGSSNTLKASENHPSHSDLLVVPYGSQLQCASQSKLSKNRSIDEPPRVTSPSLESEIMTLKQQKLGPEDDDLHFMKSLLPYIKGLPPLAKLNVRSQMLQIVTQEVTRHNNQQRNTTVATQTTNPSAVLLFAESDLQMMVPTA